jgi:hypothetical protein
MRAIYIKPILFLIMILSIQFSMAQSELRRKASERSSTDIDTLFVFPPRTYISLKMINDDKFKHSDLLTELTVDSIYTSLAPYFNDTSTYVGTRFRPKKPRIVRMNSYSTVESNQIVDSIEVLFANLKEHSGIKDIRVPDYFFQLMEENKARFALVIFEYGYIKSDVLFRLQVIETVLLNVLLRGTNITAKPYHSELSCCILDLENRSIAYYGQVSINELPLSTTTLIEHLHWIFDPYFVKSRFTQK